MFGIHFQIKRKMLHAPVSRKPRNQAVKQQIDEADVLGVFNAQRHAQDLSLVQEAWPNLPKSVQVITVVHVESRERPNLHFGWPGDGRVYVNLNCSLPI